MTGFNNATKLIGNAYISSGKFRGHDDNAVRLFKAAHGELQPALEQHGGQNTNNNVAKVDVRHWSHTIARRTI